VRELQNIIERAAVLSQRPTIGVEDLPAHLYNTVGPVAPTAPDDDAPWVPMPLDQALREPERRILLRALRGNQWNRQKTADQLGINRTTLYKKMRTLGIEAADQHAA
jgi:DNA-binding NtrC family response regulator